MGNKEISISSRGGILMKNQIEKSMKKPKTHSTVADKSKISSREEKTGFPVLIKKIVFSGYFQLLLRIVLGVTFITASLDKIAHPRLFAEVIFNYQILPLSLVNLASAVMPLLELIAGITIIIGFWTRSSSFILSGLTLIFIAAISFNMLRGLEVNCGCFDVISGSKIGVELLVRDILLFIAGILIILEKKPKFSLDWVLDRQK
jgi:uncharacterized membrane protein YphA (DoxX/SURF4 family)